MIPALIQIKPISCKKQDAPPKQLSIFSHVTMRELVVLKKPPRFVYIYVLICPNEKRVRYVGKTSDHHSRLNQHWHSTRTTKVSLWIQKLREEGSEKPELRLICKCFSDEWEEYEREWIAFYRSMYDDLLNMTDGGIGARFRNRTIRTHHPHKRKPLSADVKLAMKKRAIEYRDKKFADTYGYEIERTRQELYAMFERDEVERITA